VPGAVAVKKLDDESLDAVLERAAFCMTTLDDSSMCDEHGSLIAFGIAFLVGALALEEGHADVTNSDVARAGRDMILAYIEGVVEERG
jgi:hypothetical protein